MKELKGRERSSRIHIGDSLAGMEMCLTSDDIIVITDANIRKLHSHAFPEAEVIDVEPGEGSKNLRTVEHIYEKLLELGADRQSFIVGIGGGIVCDITGFAASTYMRGLRFALVPTTLLAQVDAAIGGKNGVNLRHYKNIVGTINQPDFVLVDMGFLDTLPPREFRNGMAEVIKSAAICSRSLFEYLEDNRENILGLDTESLGRIINDTVDIKLDIVSRDEFETGERRKLNFGHTFGHALEKLLPYSHGEAISIGMMIAAKMSVARGMLGSEDSERLERLIRDYGLPHKAEMDTDSMIDALGKDKKRVGDKVKFVLLNGIGSAEIVEIPLDELKKV